MEKIFELLDTLGQFVCYSLVCSRTTNKPVTEQIYRTQTALKHNASNLLHKSKYKPVKIRTLALSLCFVQVNGTHLRFTSDYGDHGCVAHFGRFQHLLPHGHFFWTLSGAGGHLLRNGSSFSFLHRIPAICRRRR